MTDEYVNRLVKLAKEIRDMKGTIGSEEYERQQVLFASKLNFLLGYIIALEDSIPPVESEANE